MTDSSRPENQIVPFPKFAVRCRVCRYAHDSAEDSAEGAIAEVSAMHEPSHREYVATAYAERA